MELTLSEFTTSMGTIGANVFHYKSPSSAGIPRIVWAEYYSQDFVADNVHHERIWEISINAYVKSPSQTFPVTPPPAGTEATAETPTPVIELVETLLNGLPIWWRLDSIQYEDDTGLLHYEWKVRICG